MKYATLVVGLPASGKTHLIHNLRKTMNTLVCDDTYCDIDTMEEYDAVILSHPAFCLRPVRDSVVVKLLNNGYKVSTFYFENDPEQCLRNAKERPDKKVDGYIRYLSQSYDPPSGSLKVWRPKGE